MDLFEPEKKKYCSSAGPKNERKNKEDVGQQISDSSKDHLKRKTIYWLN